MADFKEDTHTVTQRTARNGREYIECSDGTS